MKYLRLIALAVLAGSAAVAVASSNAPTVSRSAALCCDNPLPPCDPSCIGVN
jgi:hypothetical protein